MKWKILKNTIHDSSFNFLLDQQETRKDIESIITELSLLNIQDVNMDITNDSLFLNFSVDNYSIYYDYFFESELDEENEIISLIYHDKSCVASIKGSVQDVNKKISNFLKQ